MLINRISRLLGERRSSIMDMARATGLGYSTAFRLYANRTKGLDYATLNALCEYLQVAPCEILEWVPDQHETGATETRHA